MDVVDGRLAVLQVQRGGLEEDVCFGCVEPAANVGDVRIRLQIRSVRGDELREFEALSIGVPSQATGGYAGDPESDSVTVAQFGGAIRQQLRQRAIDVAETEKAEVVGADGGASK